MIEWELFSTTKFNCKQCLISIGNTGYAFRSSKRFSDTKHIEENLYKYYIMKNMETNEIIAASKITIFEGGDNMNISQLAVDPKHQVIYIVVWNQQFYLVENESIISYTTVLLHPEVYAKPNVEFPRGMQ